jgi:hypothetical protein
MVLNTKTIFVELLDEGTTVMRPTQAEALGGDVYRLLPTADYDPEDEHWEFPPDSIVRCVKEARGHEEVWVARERVQEPARRSKDLNESTLRASSTSSPVNVGVGVS